MAKAISYTYSIFPKPSRYHLDGRYRIDNNLVENAIRLLAIGRKTTSSAVMQMQQLGQL
jgi:hypothetical protein